MRSYNARIINRGQAEGSILVVDTAASKENGSETSGTKYSNAETGEFHHAEYRVSLYTGESYIETIGTDGSGYEERDAPLDEKLEHEISHVTDHVQNAPSSGTGVIEASGAVVPVGEARAINRTNAYRARKGRNYNRISYSIFRP